MVYQKPSDYLVNFIKEHYKEYGKVTEYKKYSNDTKIKGNVKTTSLNFRCKFEKSDQTVYEKLIFVETADGEFLIKALIYSSKQWFIDDYDSFIEKSEETAQKYYEINENETYSKLAGILDDKDLAELFEEVINDRVEYYGKTTKHSLLSTSAILKDDQPIVIQRYECETDQNMTVYEEFWFVRIGEEFLINDYYYAGTLEALDE